ncbi:UbiD family decarboxylase [Consotaella salsifontis]|uniref:3-octaprenyl-4hydroxybenzoate decarboxylase n=1 Tax=Consotaella salsifontis TaxID=1365950 RepID=A0A1T4RZF0_9HYPH|nr:UbiD family decarboxylase [Consotaella salsifontis]SKA21394.1 3-octaprenyl-4hydroxybenzoate decarboxylase [Consotaella salsifontis]
MYQRSQPAFADLRAFLDHCQRQGELKSVTAPVDVAQEMSEIHRRVIAQGGPVLRFDRPVSGDRSFGLPVVANLYGTRERVAAALGTNLEGLKGLGEMMAWLRSPKPPESARAALDLMPAAKAALNSRPRSARDGAKWEELAPDLSLLPVQTCWPGDAGPLITWPLVVTRAPGRDDFSTYNLGVYRMQVLDKRRAIARWLQMRGGAVHHRQWVKAGKEMPVAVVIGADPATMMAAVMPAPEGTTELSLSGILSGGRPAMVPCRTIPLHVPASAEIVLEGTVSLTETAQEGPFGDHTGYYNPPETFPVFNLKHMRVRRDGVYLSTFTGRAPDEPAVIADTFLEVFKPLLKQQMPEVLDVWLPPEACSYRVAVIAIDKRYAGQARRVMMGFWSLLPQFTMTKMLIVVDGDIDIRSWSDVMWAVATRMDPSRDLLTVDRTPIDHLDFASPLEGLGGKLGIDATNKIGAETSRGWGTVMRTDPDIARRVTERWNDLFGA